jgi:hypothetical protein
MTAGRCDDHRFSFLGVASISGLQASVLVQSDDLWYERDDLYYSGFCAGQVKHEALL